MTLDSTAVLTTRTLTELDHARLTKYADGLPASAIQSVLDNAELVAPSEIAGDVVTMRSRVQVVAPTGDRERRTLTLSYPLDADPSTGCISVLSPVGTALLGLRVGDMANWVAPDGSGGQLQVAAIAYQPEASGEHLL
ncbi:GreA/GreB family elongation factor [Variovorax ginsengisoli]|uniref:Regulator of nucleoside diphosphate kinase n=1 Tax=Variovorax ginsengisoli TaxID=363844 RepID=A0ABT9SCP6_9BURK|nr:GreA/GreB family elongation factor [Variovorax ginsengisoli]MDP9901623.1 regulator of nucleoside diphosphate kinase [Variovorax ginsengisoli]